MKNKIMCVIICLMLVGCASSGNVSSISNTGNSTTYTLKSETKIGSQTLIETKEITQEDAERLKEEEVMSVAKKKADEIIVIMSVMEYYKKAYKSLDNQ